MPTEIGGTKSRSGGMSVSLAGPDGRVVGGGLAGLLVAAGPVQVHHFVKVPKEIEIKKICYCWMAPDLKIILQIS